LRERKRPPILIGTARFDRDFEAPANNPKVRWASIDPSECGEPQRLFSGALESRPELPFSRSGPGCAARFAANRGAADANPRGTAARATIRAPNGTNLKTVWQNKSLQ
jgi:hypothetical protein